MLQPPSPPPPDEEIRDLGFGSIVTRESRQRLLNPDGSFNVKRTGLNFWTSLSLYHTLLTLSWPRFFGAVMLFYLGTNAFFACLYVVCGPHALSLPDNMMTHNAFLNAFFFSVQTLGTIGYGHVNPIGLAANIVVTVEAFTGLLGIALVTGVVFARFSRPSAKILFSTHAIIAPYQDGTAFEFRIANARSNQLIEVEAKVLLSRFEMENGRQVRRFHLLPLERGKVIFFPLSWTIVHPIDNQSPLHGLTAQDLEDSDAEFLILLQGIEETFSQIVHARSSYKFDEITWNAKFTDIYNRPTDDQKISMDIGRLSEIKRL
ncbi:MAG: hypothetical protein HY774_18245 [Acidobacteria bacterium]|nr:hypothetical protein [Acidobacteriota bacterium]